MEVQRAGEGARPLEPVVVGVLEHLHTSQKSMRLVLAAEQQVQRLTSKHKGQWKAFVALARQSRLPSSQTALASQIILH